MKVLLYNEINVKNIAGLSKLILYLEQDDFQSADVKKVGDNLYRARLNKNDRILLSIYHHEKQVYALILEYIKNHAYEKSRFLKGTTSLDEAKISDIKSLVDLKEERLVYVNAKNKKFNILDKVISFDSSQQSIYNLPSPLVIIGSAGSGKTALTLEKMKYAVGNVLYVTQSIYLVKNSRDLYYANHYENEDQQVDFLSFQEFLESIKMPDGTPVSFKDFRQWFQRHQSGHQFKDAHKLFEEFRGVITGSVSENGWLSKQEYLALGIKESIFLLEERAAIYDIFKKYLQFLSSQNLYDSNVISHQYLDNLTPRYDFVIVDEVQDLTNVQLYLIIKSLHHAHDFILCGDSNQIVHPNFFSWSKVKSLFYTQAELNQSEQLIRILNTNYRNSPQVTEIANKILKLKNNRFGSIDKESHFLVKSNGHNTGEVIFLQDNDNIKQELDAKTKSSTHFAVIVMTEDQKPVAQKSFSTPLVFTIQEAKGLEYENIILYNFLSQEEQRYREISRGVTAEALEQDIKFSRVKDKTDKSLEIYKFYVNSLYVALTRAIKNLYWIEKNAKQPILSLIGLSDAQSTLAIKDSNSSLEEWRKEAHKLTLQGKEEQAKRIRDEILKQKIPPWEVISGDVLVELKEKAFVDAHKKAKLALFEYALVYEDQFLLTKLATIDFKPAKNPTKGMALLKQNHYTIYSFKKLDSVLRDVVKYGVDFRNIFNQTPLMIASWIGNVDLIKILYAEGANTDKVDENGLNAFQISLSQADLNKQYANTKLAFIYEHLEPASMSVQIDGRLIKLDNHHMEFFMLNMMIALFYRALPNKIMRGGAAFTTQDFIDAIEFFPLSVLPNRRKKRAYLSSILSKNEIDKVGARNRKLFMRMKRGSYLFNPNMLIKIDGNWINIYDLLSFSKLAPRYEKERADWSMDFNTHRLEILEHNKNILMKQLHGKKTV